MILICNARPCYLFLRDASFSFVAKVARAQSAQTMTWEGSGWHGRCRRRQSGRGARRERRRLRHGGEADIETSLHGVAPAEVARSSDSTSAVYVDQCCCRRTCTRYVSKREILIEVIREFCSSRLRLGFNL